jgi:hypothetical protein
MFLFGQGQGLVRKGRLMLPKEFHLKHKQLFYCWKDENTLYLSDSKGALHYAASREIGTGTIKVDAKDRIDKLERFENNRATILGNLTTVEIRFENLAEKEENLAKII